MPEALRAFLVSGADPARVLEQLHVVTELAGAWEREDGVVVWLRGELPVLPGATVRELPADQANATATGREGDGPILVCPDLLVRPPWVASPAGFTGVELVLPRGSAFGSGEHGSTRAALRCIHALWREPWDRFADVGTGSGILALYAQVRGAGSIQACDVDPFAVRAARALLPGAAVSAGGPETLPAAADFVVANLTGRELAEAMDGILACWTRRGPLVLSGMRGAEVGEIAGRVPARRVHTEVVEDFTALGFAP